MIYKWTLRRSDKMNIQFFPKPFTLTELLIVLAVFCILLSLLTPALRRSLETAQGIVCSKKLSTITQLSLKLSEEENGLLMAQYKPNIGFWPNTILATIPAPFNPASYNEYFSCPSRVPAPTA